MSTIKLFNISSPNVTELEGKSVTIEKSLQSLIEKHLEEFLGVTFLQSEYSTGEKHAGRIDTLGIDENNCPVIIEYKRSTNENVINQGLYYLDWLLDHKAEFQLLVMKKNGSKTEIIEWNNARLICIAGDFTKYDTYAIQQINRNIELIRYKQFKDLLLFDLVNVKAEQKNGGEHKSKKIKAGIQRPTVTEYYDKCSDELKNRYEALKLFILSLGDDVQLKELEHYFAFRRIKNFASLKFQPATNTIVLWLSINPKEIKIEKGFSKDVSSIGHHGTGNLELRINNAFDLEKSKLLIIKSYELG